MEELKTPVVSVITPAYNASTYIGETIESVIKQTYTNWEMIIVDDCSSDNTMDIIQSYQAKDDRIKVYQLEKNSGSAVARNTAMDLAQGRFTAFLDSDDQWLPEKLAIQLAFMKDNGVAFSFTKYMRIHQDGTPTNAVSEAPATVEYDRLMKHCVIGCLTVMLDTEKIGHERMVNIRTRQDYAFWLHLTRKGFNAYGIPEVLSKYRIVEGSISRDKWKAAKQNWYVYHHIEKHSLWKTIWYFSHYALISVKNVCKYKIIK